MTSVCKFRVIWARFRRKLLCRSAQFPPISLAKIAQSSQLRPMLISWKPNAVKKIRPHLFRVQIRYLWARIQQLTIRLIVIVWGRPGLRPICRKSKDNMQEVKMSDQWHSFLKSLLIGFKGSNTNQPTGRQDATWAQSKLLCLPLLVLAWLILIRMVIRRIRGRVVLARNSLMLRCSTKFKIWAPTWRWIPRQLPKATFILIISRTI